jgi:hypothetical protein
VKLRVLVLASLTCTMVLEASAQTEHNTILSLRTDETLDRGSAVWVTPGGTRIHVCQPMEADTAPTCSIVSWSTGPGTYRFEGDIGTTGSRELRSFSIDLEGDEISVRLHVYRGRVEIRTVSPAPRGLRLELAPSDMRSDGCRYVLRNATRRRRTVVTVGTSVLAWVESRRDPESPWISHLGDGYSSAEPGFLNPGERRCLLVRPAYEEPIAGSRRIATDVDFAVTHVREGFVVSHRILVATP